jgi:hypothetical protein
MKLDFFKRADILGEPVSLSVAGRDTHQTYLGALLSLVYIGLTLAAGVIITRDYFDTTNPSVVQSTQEFYEYPEIDLNANGFGYTILIQDASVGIVKAEEVSKYVTLFALQNEKLLYFNSEGKIVNSEVKNHLLPMVPCNTLSREEIEALSASSYQMNLLSARNKKTGSV